MSRIFNDTHDEIGVSRKTRATQKIRAPKYTKYPSETTYEKEVRITEAENWKRRKGKVIRKCRDQKYTDHTTIRGEEEEVSFHAEEFNNKLSSLVSTGFTVRHVKPVYRVKLNGKKTEIVKWTEDNVVLRGTIYKGNQSRNGGEYDEHIVIHERSINGKLERHRRVYNIPFHVMQTTFFDMIEDGPGQYYMTIDNTSGIYGVVYPTKRPRQKSSGNQPSLGRGLADFPK
jgi:hypothetical protein